MASLDPWQKHPVFLAHPVRIPLGELAAAEAHSRGVAPRWDMDGACFPFEEEKFSGPEMHNFFGS